MMGLAVTWLLFGSFFAACGQATAQGDIVTVQAGESAIMPCPGISDGSAPGGYIMNRMSWTCSAGRKPCPLGDEKGRLVEFSARSVRMHGRDSRLRLERVSWSLVISPAEAEDSGQYSCSVNDRPSHHSLRLIVQDVPSRPGRPMVLRHTSRLVQLSWTPSFHTHSSPVQHYLVQTRHGDSGRWPDLEVAHQTTGNTTNTTMDGLSPFTLYTFRVLAVNALGASLASEPSYPVNTLRERPGQAPTLSYARPLSATSLEVGWQAPPEESVHGELTGYRLTYRRAEPGTPPGRVTEVVIRDSSAQRHVIEELKPFTQYRVTLQVVNPEALSPAATVNAVTGEGVPSRPENVTVTDVTDRSVTVSWMPPRVSNGLLAGYTVTWSEADGRSSSRQLESAVHRKITLSELESDRRYTVWVRGRSRAGDGRRSRPVHVRTDVGGPGPPILAEVSCPTAEALMLRWHRPSEFHRAVDFYYVLYRSEERRQVQEQMVPAQGQRTLQSAQITNLTSGQLYELRVQAATRSRLIRNRVYKGQISAPMQVRLEQGCSQLRSGTSWQPRGTTAPAAAHLAAVLASCLMVLVLSVTALLLRRRRKLWKPPSLRKSCSALPTASAGWTPTALQSVPAHVFPQAVRELQAADGVALRADWERLLANQEVGSAGDTPSAASARSQYAGSRVRLRGRQFRGNSQPDAFWVDGYRRARAFIVTAPQPGAGHLLWKLAWQHRTASLVVMGQAAGRLWPEPGGSRQCGRLLLETLSSQTLAVFTVHQLAITQTKARGRRQRLTVLECTCWPAGGVPEEPLPLLQFVQMAQQRTAETPGPVLLTASDSPCAAPLYAALATLLTQLQHCQELAVFTYWGHALSQCPLFRHSLATYALLHEALLERVSSGQTLVSPERLSEFLEQLQGGGRDSYPHPAAEQQYKHAIALEAHHFTVVSAARPYNQAKNRSLSYIPMEASRVVLTPKLSQPGSDYINASWLPGFLHEQEYILTQHPLPTTVLDFWQMLWDNQVATVACLSSEDSGVFWPLERHEVDCEGFVVRLVSEAAGCSSSYSTSWLVRTFLLSSPEGEREVRLLHLPLWPSESPQHAVMEAVQAARELHSGNSSPLVVIDRLGGTEGATFCVLSAVLEQLQCQPWFDVFTYAKQYHQRRPGVWGTMREYLFLYQAVEAWVTAGGAADVRDRQSWTGDGTDAETAAVYVADRQSWPAGEVRRSLQTRIVGVDGVLV